MDDNSIFRQEVMSGHMNTSCIQGGEISWLIYTVEMKTFCL